MGGVHQEHLNHLLHMAGVALLAMDIVDTVVGLHIHLVAQVGSVGLTVALAEEHIRLVDMEGELDIGQCLDYNKLWSCNIMDENPIGKQVKFKNNTRVADGSTHNINE